jgi:flagellar hook-associated protein 1 FlgK
MGGLNTSLLIAAHALEVAQGALTATSNNISNANTAGYTREIPQLSENQLSVSGTHVSGGGVSFDGLNSVRDQLLNLQILQQNSAKYSSDTAATALDQAQSYFTSTGGDIASALSSFSSSLIQLSGNPSNSATQQAVLSAGKNLAQAFNSTANGLTAVQSQMNTQVAQTVAQINSLSQQIAQLNGKVAQLEAAGKDGGTIEDQRGELVRQLSQLTGITVSKSSDGEVITTGNGSPLVMGGQSFTLQAANGSDGQQHVLDSNGTDITASIQGGKLGASIEVRDQTIPGYLSQLNTLATEFADAFNAAQVKGYDANGNAGQDFFSVPSNAAGAAAGISVAISSASQIAMSSDGSAGSSGNVTNLSAALTNALPSGSSPADTYSGLLFKVGNDASDASNNSTAIGQSLLQLTNLQSSISGVSIDEETTNLIRFQTAYEAAARIVSTIQHLNSVTINMVS